MKRSSEFEETLEPKRPGVSSVALSVASSRVSASVNIRNMSAPSLASLEAGVGVPRSKTKRKHNPKKSDAAGRIKKRRMTETNHQEDAIASINRLRESRQAGSRDGMDPSGV